MEVSIIIPAYNAEKHLAETIESVMAQSFQDWELIVVDDGSSDRTGDIVNDFASRDGRIRLARIKNGGVALARNRGFQDASPESAFIAFLDHDDIYLPRAIETLVNALLRNVDVVAAHGLARRCTERDDDLMDARRRTLTGGRCRTKDASATDATTFATLAYDSCICTPGIALVRRSAIQQLIERSTYGPFCPKSAPADDWDFWLRLSAHGPIAFVDSVILEWRIHENNVSNNCRLMLARQSDVRRKMLFDPNLSAAQQNLMYARYRRMIGSELRKQMRSLFRESALQARTGAKDSIRVYLASLTSLACYLKVRWFWIQKRDRGPIPWQE